MIGIVVAVDEAGCRVRVEFPDRDDGEGTALVSGWLPVGQKKTLGDLEYWLPDEGTQVACLMDRLCEDGVVLCAIYSDADPPPVADRNLFYRRFKDGSTIVYDRGAHKLSADIKGDIEVTADGHTLVKSAQGVDIDGGSGDTAGSVQGQCICPLLLNVHLMVSATVKESL